MGQDAESSRRSQGRLNSQKEKALFSSASRNHKLQDKVRALRYEKSNERSHLDSSVVRTDSRNSSSSKTSRDNFPRDRSQHDRRRVDELVRYMSEVPAYLQLLERGNTNQEKALNMGVLDWGNLQKWSGRQKPTKALYDVNSLSRCSTPSYFGSSIVGKIDQIKQPILEPRFSSSMDNNCFDKEHHKKTSQQHAALISAEVVSSIAFKRHLKPHALGLMQGNNQIEKRCSALENFNSSASDASMCSSQEVTTSLSTSTECDIPSSSEIREKDLSSRLGSNLAEVSTHDQLNTQHAPFHGNDRTRVFSVARSSCFDGRSAYQRDATDGRPRISFCSAVSENEVQASEKSGFSGVIYPEDVSFTPPYYVVPHSCPLPFNEDFGWSDTTPIVSGNDGCASPSTFGSPVRLHVPRTLRFNCNMEKTDDITSQTSKLRSTVMADCVTDDAIPPATERARETLLDLSWANRSSSLKDIHVRKHPKGGTICHDDMGEDKATCTSRARQSPLRRMLDPFLKPKLSIRFPESGANTPASFVRRLSFSDKLRPKVEPESKHHQEAPLKENVVSSVRLDSRRLEISSWACESQNAHQDEPHERSRMQALLRLAWKNGLPLFTFSMNDTDILLATMKKFFPEKDVDCTYTFYYALDGKKGGGWRNQESKSKKQGLVSKIVGRMNVSCAQLSKTIMNFPASSCFMKEFILFGTEIRPTSSEMSNALHESEIAAIVVKYPEEGNQGYSYLPYANEHRTIAGTKNRSMNADAGSNIVAILPSEVHGLSEAGGPSPLIERWRSGGTCDCGGWDVGCSLAILTENIKESCTSKADHSHSTTIGPRRNELFLQGGAKNNKPVFSMVPLNEGLFTVDFDESISVLQAFSVCVAILHQRKVATFPKLQNPIKEQTFTGDIPRKDTSVIRGKVPVAYGPCQPPLSPVGRA